MLEDIQAKKREMMKQGNGADIKVELVGVPSFMQEELIAEVEKPQKPVKPKPERVVFP